MQKLAHVIALLVAYVVWQVIGGIVGLIVAVIAIGVIEIVVMVLLGLVSAPFQSTSTAEAEKQDLDSLLEIDPRSTSGAEGQNTASGGAEQEKCPVPSTQAAPIIGCKTFPPPLKTAPFTDGADPRRSSEKR